MKKLSVMNSSFHLRAVGRLLAIVAGVLLVVVLVSVGQAAIPSASGQIDACVSRTGSLRVIDTESGKQCGPRESALSWPSSSVGGPKAYGLVQPTGDSTGNPIGADVDESRSFGLTDAMVSLVPDRSGNGRQQICFDVPFDVDNISVTLASSAPVFLSAVPDDGCAGGTNNFSVYGMDARPGFAAVAGFFIVVR